MSADPPAGGSEPNSKGGSPVKRSAPSLEQLAARYHKNRSGTEETRRTEGESSSSKNESAPSLRRLGLAGRLGNAADSANPSAPWTKSSSIPSLNEIRARLNKRGVDVSSSKWNKSGLSPTKETPPSEDKCAGALAGEGQATKKEPTESGHDAQIQSSSSGPTASEQREDNTQRDSLNEPQGKDEATKPMKSEEVDSEPKKDARADNADETNKEQDKPAPEQGSASASGSRYPAGSGQAAALAAKEGRKHPLQRAWTLYYDGQTYHKPSSRDQYESKLKCIGHFTTLESFFDTFATLHRPSQMGRNTNYHLFKAGIKPMWEDPANANGGRWVLTLREQSSTAGARAAHEALLDRSWMWLVFGFIGEHFDEDNHVTGAVCSLRTKGDRIALWLREKEPVETVNALGEKFLRLLELENVPNIQLEFSTNDGSKGHYMTVRNAPKPKQDPVSVEEEPALNQWLDSEFTLHPTDHAWYYAHHTQGKET